MRFSMIIIAFSLTLLGGCSEEQQNKLSRLGVTWLEGNYKSHKKLDGAGRQGYQRTGKGLLLFLGPG